jgi:acylphosphatase
MWDAARMRRVRAIVSGRVQGVSYRAATAGEARRLGVVGWVRNRADGTVELEAEGAVEQVDALLTWCQHGPPAAAVTGVAVAELAPTGGDSAFAIVR